MKLSAKEIATYISVISIIAGIGAVCGAYQIELTHVKESNVQIKNELTLQLNRLEVRQEQMMLIFNDNNKLLHQLIGEREARRRN